MGKPIKIKVEPNTYNARIRSKIYWIENSKEEDHTGDYWPDADYRALQAKLAALVEAAGWAAFNPLNKDYIEDLKAALDAAKDQTIPVPNTSNWNEEDGFIKEHS